MSEPIGILVDRRVLHRALSGRRTYERISLYKKVAVDELGIDIIAFAVDDINVSRNRLRGYVPSAKGWRKVSASIPKVIHKRVLYRANAPLRKLNRLHRRGTVFVNPHRIQNKEKMYTVLSREEAVKSHLPFTQAYRWRHLESQLDAGKSVILKPRIGSVGRGILKIVPLPGRRAQITGRSTRMLSRKRLRKRLNTRVGSGRYLLQQYLKLARYHGNIFDLRVPVQRDGTGGWQVPGMVAKVAVKHPFLTNMGQGGRAVPGESAIKAAFSPSIAATVSNSIVQLAIDVAQAVARAHPYAADLGLDIGVDTDGKPWLIEVNTRDQRITFYEAGMHEAFRTLYKNPIAFCAYLNQALSDKERGEEFRDRSV